MSSGCWVKTLDLKPIGELIQQLPVWGASPNRQMIERIYEIGSPNPYDYVAGRNPYAQPSGLEPLPLSEQLTRYQNDYAKQIQEVWDPRRREARNDNLISPSVTPYKDYGWINDGIYGPLPGYGPPGVSGPTGPIGPSGPTDSGTRAGNTQSKNQKPNKMANDDKWGYKVAWSSKDLFERQQELETYSAEIAMMMEAIRQVAIRAVGRTVNVEQLEFFANFGAAITNNAQMIAITLQQPISLQIRLTRKLVNGRLDWRADVGVTRDTPERVEGRMLDMSRIARDTVLDKVYQAAVHTEEKSKEKKRRKIRL
jgi:hypothetical protein